MAPATSLAPIVSGSPLDRVPCTATDIIHTNNNIPHPKYSFSKSKIQVLALENVNESALNIFRNETFKLDVVPRALTEQELIDKIKGYHILCIRSKTKITKKVFHSTDKLLCIGCFCIGTDQVDLPTAASKGIPVFNAPFSNTRSVAELVLGEIIALSRNFVNKSKLLHESVWDKSANGCMEVRGKTLGIIGYGHIGSQLSILAEAVGMHVVYYDIVSVLPMGNGKGMNSMEEVLENSNFVSLHVPKAVTTNNLISKKELASMQKGSFLINASRGTVVDIEALAESLKSHHLAGAAIDVFPTEPTKNGPGFITPLNGLPNVILTPHIGGSTLEAQKNIGIEVSSALIKFINQGSSIGAVNFPNQDIPFSVHCHRILNVHLNKPGVLSAINTIISKNNCNVKSQVLSTSADIGYLIIDVDKETSHETKDAISNLQTSIVTRILY